MTQPAIVLCGFGLRLEPAPDVAVGLREFHGIDGRTGEHLLRWDCIKDGEQIGLAKTFPRDGLNLLAARAAAWAELRQDCCARG